MSKPIAYRHTASVQILGARRVWRPDGTLVSDGMYFLTAEEFVTECNFLLAARSPREAAPSAPRANIIRFEFAERACAFCGTITRTVVSSQAPEACICPECVSYAKRNLADAAETSAEGSSDE